MHATEYTVIDKKNIHAAISFKSLYVNMNPQVSLVENPNNDNLLLKIMYLLKYNSF